MICESLHRDQLLRPLTLLVSDMASRSDMEFVADMVFARAVAILVAEGVSSSPREYRLRHQWRPPRRLHVHQRMGTDRDLEGLGAGAWGLGARIHRVGDISFGTFHVKPMAGRYEEPFQRDGVTSNRSRACFEFHSQFRCGRGTVRSTVARGTISTRSGSSMPPRCKKSMVHSGMFRPFPTSAIGQTETTKHFFNLSSNRDLGTKMSLA